MARIYLCGHGWWKTVGSSTPFAFVPASTTLAVYTPVGRYLDLGVASAIISGDTTFAPALDPDQTFAPYSSCPNTILRPAPEYAQIFLNAGQRGGVQVEMVQADTPLSELLQRFAGNELHWMACRPRLGDKSVEEGGFNNDYLPFWGIGV